MITEQEYLKSVKIVNEYLLQQVKLKEYKKIHIVDSDLTIRLYNILKSHGIQYLNELCTMTPHDFMKWRNFGKKTFDEVERVLIEHNLPRNW